ncbi:uncharacterized protein LOC132561630 [Ylistrum balloti]|uniref:uncharacterized protein LOC132561630 n=1 Tax=Ylistrum balloti TaxID=509963 RepID=UPI0029059BBA|nr:uncharacterized protein LOC132561630 [Ylistrum balloti]
MSTKQSSGQQEQLPVRIKGSSNCPHHKQKEIIFICNDCDEELICATCCVTSHKSHELVELSSVRSQKNSMLQEFINNTEKHALPQLKMEVQATQKEMTENSLHICGLRSKVTDEGKRCKQEIDDLITENIKICDKIEILNQNLLKDHITQLLNQISSLESLLNECKQTLQMGTAVLVHDMVLDVQNLDSKIPSLPKQQWPEFHSCQDTLDKLKQVVGTISINQPPKEKFIKIKLRREPEVQLRFKFRHHITTICPTQNSQAWICHFESNSLELIDIKGQIQKVIKCQHQIRDINISTKTGHIWFCCREEKIVCEVSSLSKAPTIKFRTNDPPYSICVTKEGFVILGTENKVSIYTENGVILHSSTRQTSGIASPGEITQCPLTGNIAVLSAEVLKRDDSDEDDWKGQIIIYNKRLQVKSKFKGDKIQTTGAVREETIGPGSIAYDRNGNLVVADMKRNTIELISGLGQHIKTLCCNTQGQGALGLEDGQVLWTTSKPSPGKWEIQVLKYYSV